MKTNTMKWRILKSNIVIMVGFILLTAIVFNITIRIYMEKDTRQQLLNIASQAEDTALRKGPDFLSGKDAPPPQKDKGPKNDSEHNDMYEFYFMLDRSFSDTASILNSDYILIDSNRNIINTNKSGYFHAPETLTDMLDNTFRQKGNLENGSYLKFKSSGVEYIAVIKSVSHKNSFGLGWLVVYSSLKKLNQLQLVINIILLLILTVSSILIFIFSSIIAKRITTPFSRVSQHLAGIAERNFQIRLDLPVDDELQEVVRNINRMSEKLETYDKAQQTFFQNASHEFRTPLMSIQSYAEGIKYDVIESGTAVDIIIAETKRLTNLVDDLLFLSRLDTIEESYYYTPCNLNTLIRTSIDRMKGMALHSKISIEFHCEIDDVFVLADEEKLLRAVSNILANDIRYAESQLKITLEISKQDINSVEISILDDGPGFDVNELPNIFDRFYKGKKGNIGLGLAIAKNVIEKHNGRLSALNTHSGALFILRLPVIKG